MRQSRQPIEELTPFLLDVPNPRSLPPDSPRLAPTPPLRWSEVFGNDHPVEIEIGFGKGLFLLTQGAAHPETNYLGIEIERKYVLLTAARMAKQKLTNVKLACTDARWFLRERVVAGSVAAIHVYFPDPWWKKRHKKRKLLTRAFVDQCVRVLRDGGVLRFATDVEDYFNESLEILNEVAALRRLSDVTPDENAMTNFERKYRAEGRPIYRAEYAQEPRTK